MEVDEEKEKVKVKILDVGGYHQVPMRDLRQIRVDFIHVPFQATQCGLANISPLDKEVGWSNEAIHHFKNLTANHVLRAFVAGYDVDNDKTLIHLFKINGNQVGPRFYARSCRMCLISLMLMLIMLLLITATGLH